MQLTRQCRRPTRPWRVDVAGARLGVDVGSVRIGVARCDADQTHTFPVATVPRERESPHVVAGLARDHGADIVYVGHPLSLSGTETQSTRDAVAWAVELAAALDGHVWLVDERLSTRSAQARLHASGRSTRQSREVIDQAAAIVLLEQALEIERRTGQPAGVQVEVQG